jgi:hypothetical protein
MNRKVPTNISPEYDRKQDLGDDHMLPTMPAKSRALPPSSVAPAPGGGVDPGVTAPAYS